MSHSALAFKQVSLLTVMAQFEKGIFIFKYESSAAMTVNIPFSSRTTSDFMVMIDREQYQLTTIQQKKQFEAICCCELYKRQDFRINEKLSESSR